MKTKMESIKKLVKENQDLKQKLEGASKLLEKHDEYGHCDECDMWICFQEATHCNSCGKMVCDNDIKTLTVCGECTRFFCDKCLYDEKVVMQCGKCKERFCLYCIHEKVCRCCLEK